MAAAQRCALADTQAQTLRKLEVYETAWRRLHESTGAGDVEGVLGEIDSMADQATALEAQCQDNEARLRNGRQQV